MRYEPTLPWKRHVMNRIVGTGEDVRPGKGEVVVSASDVHSETVVSCVVHRDVTR